MKVGVLTAHCSKTNKEARLLGSLLAFGFWQLGTGSEGWTSVQRLCSFTDNRWAKAFVGKDRDYMQKHHCQL